MKKAFVLALLAVSVSVMAQKVSPIDFQVPNPNLDSLKTMYQTEPSMYRAALEKEEMKFADVIKHIKATKEEMKTEQNIYMSMSTALKDATKTTANLKKIYEKEAAELKTMQKSIEAQQVILANNPNLNAETRDSYSALLETEQQDLGYALREVNDRQMNIGELEIKLQNMQTRLLTYNADLHRKGHLIKEMVTLCKERLAAVKAEKKNAKK